MIALIAIAIGIAWLSLCTYLVCKGPKWLGIRPIGGFATFLLFLMLLVAPFLDHVVGMWQFDRLCEEKAVVWVSLAAGTVKRAIRTSPATVELPGYLITIRLQRDEYSDTDTGKPFLSEVALHTRGGVVGSIASLGNTTSCWPREGREVFKKLNIDKLLEEGKRP